MAYVAILDGECVGIVGLARAGTHARFFSEFKPELRPYIGGPTIMRAVLRAFEWVKKSKIPVITVASPEEPDSMRIVARLGFQHFGTCGDGEVYLWPR